MEFPAFMDGFGVRGEKHSCGCQMRKDEDE